MVDVNPLREIETILGEIETWPSEIIILIFIEEYERLNVFRVISFSYGNKVPVGLALKFYSKCNKHNTILALSHFTLLYNIWDMDMQTTCTCTYCGYYDMTHKMYVDQKSSPTR